MNIQRNVVYADPAMTGDKLRSALKELNHPTTFLNHNHHTTHPNRRYAQSEEAIYFQELAESRGYSVDDVVVTEDSVLIRTKF